MENKINESQTVLLSVLTCLLALSLAINAVQAILGLAAFAWWHLFTLGALVSLTAASMEQADKAKLLEYIRLLRNRAKSTFSGIRTKVQRAVTARPPFLSYPNHRPQTEP